MDLNYTKEETAFRGEVREFIRGHLPGDLSRKVLEHKRLGKEDRREIPGTRSPHHHR